MPDNSVDFIEDETTNSVSTETTEEIKGKNKKKKSLSKKKKKKIIIFSVIALLIIAGILVYFFFFADNKKKGSETYEYIRTTTLMKTSLNESVTVSGSVSSGYEASVTVSESAKQYKILSVDVEVGDVVKEGDVIATLDTEDLLESIEKAQENYNDNVKSAQTSYDRAVSSYEKAVEQHEDNLETYEDDVENAYDTYKTAKNNYEDASDEADKTAATLKAVKASYDLAVDEIKSYQESYDAAKSDYETKKAALYTDAAADQSSYTIDDKTNEIKDGSTAYWTDYQTAQFNMNSAQQDLDLAKTGCIGVGTDGYNVYGFNNIESAYKTAQSDNERAEQNLSSMYNSYQNSIKSYNNAVDKYEDEEDGTSLENSKQQVEDALEKLENAKSNTDTLDNLNDALENCTLKATIDGTVVSLNAVVGSQCNGTVATIEDLDSLVVDVTVSSNDISSISTGMQCIITSDATENEINGVLSQINPVASNSGSFGATVKVTDENSGLLVGIQAQVEIIISSTEDVFSVPIDAVGTEEDGTKYVLRKTGGSGTDMTFEHVAVTVGESNDYYCEINSDDLNVGDVIRSSSDLSEGIVSSDEDDGQNQFGFDLSALVGGGGPGGDMPSGGDFGGDRPSGGFSGGGSDGGNFTPPSGGGGPGGN